MMRRKIVAGNWKMHKDVQESYQFVKRLLIKLLDIKRIDIILFPSFTSLFHISELLKESAIKLGAQNMHWAEQGAFTGEISAGMIRSCSADYIILGHSERRHIFNETDTEIRKKINSALDHDLIPLVCVGEKLEERESGQTEAVLNYQFDSAFNEMPPEKFSRAIIAYEPVWAIGTGINATPEQASEAHRFLRSLIGKQFGSAMAEETRILYGGSVKSSNAKNLISREDIDGFLIGGASLKEDEFSAIAQIVENHVK